MLVAAKTVYLAPDLDGGPDGTLLPSREDDAHRPISVYGETKSEGEVALAESTFGRVPATIIRPQNVIGYGQALHNPYTGVLAAFLARLKEGRELLIYGDGTQTRDFVHVQDVARLIEWCLNNDPTINESPRVLNCGTGVRTSLVELARYSIEAAPIGDVPLVHIDVKRAGDIDHAYADLSRIRAVGAPLPSWTTRAAIADFISLSWEEKGAGSDVWEQALDELSGRGLTA